VAAATESSGAQRPRRTPSRSDRGSQQTVRYDGPSGFVQQVEGVLGEGGEHQNRRGRGRRDACWSSPHTATVPRGAPRNESQCRPARPTSGCVALLLPHEDRQRTLIRMSEVPRSGNAILLAPRNVTASACQLWHTDAPARDTSHERKPEMQGRAELCGRAL